MQVAELKKVREKKVQVLMEDGSSFVLYSKEALRLGISEGIELDDELLDHIYGEILSKRAKKRCLNLLKSMDRTCSQLRETLKRDGYPDRIAEEALAYVSSYGYTDDKRYAENYLRLYRGKKSLKQIEAELRRRGICDELIRDLCRDYPGEDGDFSDDEPDRDAIRYYMKKRHFDFAAEDEKSRRRFISYLMRKGFSLTDILHELGDAMQLSSDGSSFYTGASCRAIDDGCE